MVLKAKSFPFKDLFAAFQVSFCKKIVFAEAEKKFGSIIDNVSYNEV